MTDPPAGTVTLYANGSLPRSYTIDADHPFRFGRVQRDGIVGLDPTDDTISRAAGLIELRDNQWALTNTSTKRALTLELPDHVLHQTLPPTATAMLTGPTVVLVTGSVRTHDITVVVPTVDTAADQPDTLDGTRTRTWVLNRSERVALAALAAGYLRRWPRHDPNPLPYSDAAALIGSTPASVRRHAERVRERLVDDGVPGLQGTHGLRALIEALIADAELGVDDLELLTT